MTFKPRACEVGAFGFFLCASRSLGTCEISLHLTAYKNILRSLSQYPILVCQSCHAKFPRQHHVALSQGEQLTKPSKEAAMKKGCIVVLIIAGALAVLAMIGVTIFLSKTKDIVQDIATGVGVSPEVIDEVKTLNRRYAFDEGSERILSEDQMQRFIQIKEDFADRIQNQREALETLGDEAKGGAGWQEAAQAYKLLAEIRKDFLRSLDKHRMSPKEYLYLTQQVYGAYFTSSAKQGYEQAAEGMRQAQAGYEDQMKRFEEQLADPKLSEEARKAIRQTQKSYKQAMSEMGSSAEKMKEEAQKLPQENAELIEKYRDKLQRLDTFGFEYWGLSTMAIE